MTGPSINVAIWEALKARTLSMIFSPAIPVVLPGAKVTPKGDRIEVMNIVIAPSRILIGAGPHDRRGTLQLTLKHQLPIKTYEKTQELAGKIAAHFPADLKMKFGVCVKVLSDPEVHEGFEDAGYWVTPIRIRWQAFA